jgi:8-oxo-dGTP diphosphatase
MRKYPDRPWVAIGVVVHQGDNILLIKRSKEPNFGKWSIPGGAQNVGETLFECAIREVSEETSVKIVPKSFIDNIDSIHTDKLGQIQYHYTIIEICALWQSGTPTPDDDVSDTKWVHINEIENYGMNDETIRIIRSSHNKILSYLSLNDSLTEE